MLEDSYPQEDKNPNYRFAETCYDGMPSDRLDVTESVDSQVVQDMHHPLVSAQMMRYIAQVKHL